MSGQPPLFSYDPLLQEADTLLQDILPSTTSPDTSPISEEVRSSESLVQQRTIVKVRVSNQGSCTSLSNTSHESAYKVR